MNNNNMEIVYATAPNLDNAKIIAKELLKSGLIACVNMFNSTSIYSWENELKMDNEYVMILKTNVSLVEEVIQKVKQYNEHEVPAIFSLPICKIDPSYFAWLNGVLTVPLI